MKLKILATGMLIVFLAACSLPSTGTEEPAMGNESTPVPAENDFACLQGVWEMSNTALNEMLASRVPVAGMSIPTGTFRLTFDGNTFGYGSDVFALRMEIPGGYMEAEAIFLVSGNFSTADGVVTFTDQLYTSEVITWRAMIDGEVSETTGATSIFLPAPGSGTYTCSGTSLSLPSASGTGEAFTMVFSRVP